MISRIYFLILYFLCCTRIWLNQKRIGPNRIGVASDNRCTMSHYPRKQREDICLNKHFVKSTELERDFKTTKSSFPLWWILGLRIPSFPPHANFVPHSYFSTFTPYLLYLTDNLTDKRHAPIIAFTYNLDEPVRIYHKRVKVCLLLQFVWQIGPQSLVRSLSEGRLSFVGTLFALRINDHRFFIPSFFLNNGVYRVSK